MKGLNGLTTDGRQTVLTVFVCDVHQRKKLAAASAATSRHHRTQVTYVIHGSRRSYLLYYVLMNEYDNDMHAAYRT